MRRARLRVLIKPCHAVDVLSTFVELILTQFEAQVLDDEEYACKTQSKTCHIDNRKEFILVEIP